MFKGVSGVTRLSSYFEVLRTFIQVCVCLYYDVFQVQWKYPPGSDTLPQYYLHTHQTRGNKQEKSIQDCMPIYILCK